MQQVKRVPTLPAAALQYLFIFLYPITFLPLAFAQQESPEQATLHFEQIGIEFRYDSKLWESVPPPSPGILVLLRARNKAVPTLNLVAEPIAELIPFSAISRWEKRLQESYSKVGLSEITVLGIKEISLPPATSALRATLTFQRGSSLFQSEVVSFYRGELLIHLTHVAPAESRYSKELSLDTALSGLTVVEALDRGSARERNENAPSLLLILSLCGMVLVSLVIVLILRKREHGTNT